MSKILVVFHSYSGNTRAVGRAIAARLGADTEEIVDLKQKHGALLYLIGGFKAKLGSLTKIAPAQKNPADYDLVIIGSPVYAAALASPVRTYVAQHRAGFKRVALFVTGGDPSTAPALSKFAQALGQAPVATLGVAQADVKADAYAAAVETFCAQLGG